MTFTLIRGTFHAVNYSPDGDSIRFRPDDPATSRRLAGPPTELNARGHAQLRIEAIDTLETHYTVRGGGTLHQPLGLAHQAGDALLDFVGIADVTWDSAHRTVLAASDGTRGHILSRAVEKNRRPVAFVYAGDPPEADGSEVFLDAARLRGSYNHHALRTGLAYTTYYTGLFSDLRDELTVGVAEARDRSLGVHAEDATNAGFEAASLAVVTDERPIMPKLFRRLAEYMVARGTAVGFKDKLAEAAEPVLDVRTVNFTHFDTFVEQEDGGSRIRLTRRPEELVFDAMPSRPTNDFALMLAGEATTGTA